MPVPCAICNKPTTNELAGALCGRCSWQERYNYKMQNEWQTMDYYGDWPDEIVRLRTEVSILKAKLEQIAIVCTENMDRDKNHRIALDYVRQIANEPKD